MSYQHVQWGYLAIPTFLIFLLVDWFSFSADNTAWLVAVIVTFEASLLGVVLWFSRLEVRVDDDRITAAFGNGRPRRLFAMGEIRAVRAVRNRWYYGFGVRVIANGAMYNVWGLDAAEVELESGRVFRIGTDDVDQLEASIGLALDRRSA